MTTKKSRRRRRRPRYACNDRRFFLLIGLAGLIIVLSLAAAFHNKPHNSIKSDDPEAFFQTMAPYAQHYGPPADIFPSLILAQSALESDFGRSVLSSEYHNYFGIKQTGSEPGVSFDTLEHENGAFQHTNASFRSYKSVSESVSDYVALISNYERYVGVRAAATPEEAAYALVQGGYATDPSYAEKIIGMIHEFDLTRFDQPT